MSNELNIFAASAATRPDAPLYGAAATRGWLTGSLRADDGLDFSAEFDVQASARLGASVAEGLGRFQADAGVAGHAGLRMQAGLPLDLFESAGVVARLRLEASLNAQAQASASMSLVELSDLVTPKLPAELRPYLRLLIQEAEIGATVWARAAFAAMAVAEATAVADLFPRGDDPAGISAVFRYGYAWGYGGAWGVTANYGFDTARLLRRLADQVATDLGHALTAYRKQAGIADDNPLAGLIDASQVILPATLDTLVTWCLNQRDATTDAQKESLGDALLNTLRTLLADALLPQLLRLAVDTIATALGTDADEPVDDDAAREVWASVVRAVTALRSSSGKGSPLEPVGAVAALIADASDLFHTPEARLVRSAVTCAGALVVLIADASVADTPSLRHLLGAPPQIQLKTAASVALLNQLGGVLAQQNVLPSWLVAVFGDVVRITTLLTGGSTMTRAEAATALNTLLTDIEKAFADAGLWDHLNTVLAPDLVRAIRAQARILIDVCATVAADEAVDAHRIREAVSTGIVILIGRPLSEMSKAIAGRGFDAVPPALREMANRIDTSTEDLDINASWDDLARQVAGTTVGFPVAQLMRHVAHTTEQWTDTMLPGELRLLDNYLLADMLVDRILEVGPRQAISEFKAQLLPIIGRHVVEHVLSSMEFLLKDSVNLFSTMAEGTGTQLLRTLELSAIVSFRAAEESVAWAEAAFAKLQEEENRLEREVERLAGEFFLQVARVADTIRNLDSRVGEELTQWLIRHCLGEAAAADMPDWVRNILTGLVTTAVHLAGGGAIGATQAAVRTLGDTVQASGEALRIMAESQEGSDVGVEALILSLFRGDQVPPVTVPIGIDFPNPFLPFLWIHIDIARVQVPANIIAGVVTTLLFDATGAGPIVRGLNDTANSLRLTKSALASVRRLIAAGSPQQMRQALEAAKPTAPMEVEVVSPEPGTVAPSQGKIVFRLHGANQSFVEPQVSGLPAQMEPRVRILLNGRQVPLSTVTWTYTAENAVGELPYHVLGSITPQGVAITPGAATVTVLLAGGLDGGPAPARASWHFIAEPAPPLTAIPFTRPDWFPIAIKHPFYKSRPLPVDWLVVPQQDGRPLPHPVGPRIVNRLPVPDPPILVAHQSGDLTRIVDHTGQPI
ncbi:hypothetical protein ABZ865_41910 [Streptomyces sp. NPDC047085]|uniref:hypothetical protein n=1 Tax=Streptomyces sp. NPDC047085 TaxID=3155140 RepID=UPI0033E48680